MSSLLDERTLTEFRRAQRAKYKTLESEALSPLVGGTDVLPTLVTREIVRQVEQNRNNLSDREKGSLSKKLSDAIDLRQEVADLYEDQHPGQASHLYFMDVIRSCMRLLDISIGPYTNSAQASAIVREINAKPRNELYGLEDLQDFLGSIQRSIDMITDLWDRVSTGERTLGVGNVASSCLTNFTMSEIILAEMSNPEWFNSSGFIKPQLLQQLSSTVPLAQELIRDENNVNYYRTKYALEAQWYSRNFISVPFFANRLNLRIPWPTQRCFKEMFRNEYVNDPERDAITDHMREFDRIRNSNIAKGLQLVFLDRIGNIPDSRLNARHRNAVQRSAESFLQHIDLYKDQLQDIVREAFENAIPRVIRGLELYMEKPWLLATVQTWLDNSYYNTREAIFTRKEFAAMAHIYEYGVRHNIPTPWITNPERFDAFIDKYVDMLFLQHERPRTHHAWISSVHRWIGIDMESTDLMNDRCQSTFPTRFWFLIVVSSFEEYPGDFELPRVAGQPPQKRKAPSLEWWDLLQKHIDTEMTTVNFDNRVSFNAPLLWRNMRARANTSRWAGLLHWLTSTTYPGRNANQVERLLEFNRLDGTWFDP
ncbi:hypothetical protein F5Y15DRAFT_428723 [Xylariaceae sp. FL0016]|nr:hypothetical protein F5Y15DRAFT_428723 [Xylariaceae sp. FL0016]